METKKKKGVGTRAPMPCQPAEERRHNFKEVALGYDEATAMAEAGRCLQCGRSIVDMDKCIGCGVCTHRCEFDAIHLVRVDDTQFALNMPRWYGRLAGNIVRRGVNIAAEKLSGTGKKDNAHA